MPVAPQPPQTLVYGPHRNSLLPPSAARCRAGTLACVPDKKHLGGRLSETLAPIRERRERYAADPGLVRDVVADGNRRAREVAAVTLEEAREAMKLKVPWLEGR